MRGKRFALYALAAFALVLVIQAMQTPRAAAGWNENYAYRRTILITAGENGTDDGFQENIPLSYDSGQAFENFQDSRFIWDNEEGSFEVPYWFENIIPGQSAIVWVKLPAAIGANQSVDNLRWYFGNSSAVENEDAGAIFRFFDNFDGSSLDASKWSTSGTSPTVENDVLEYDVNESTSYAYTTATFSRPLIVGAQLRMEQAYSTGSSTWFVGWSTGMDGVNGAYSSYVVSDEKFYLTIASTTTGATFTDTGNLNRVYLMANSDGAGARLEDGVSSGSIASGNTSINTQPVSLGSYTARVEYDWVFVANYVSPELSESVGGREIENVGPNKPDSPLVEDKSNPDNVASSTPPLSAIYTDNDSNDNALYVEIEVGTDTDWTSAEMWDSGWTSITAIGNNTRCEDITYAGSALTRGETYYWRIRFQDNYGNEGDWSDDQTFKLGCIEITAITASASTIDRDVDDENSGAVDNLTIYVRVQDNRGETYIENVFLWVRDNTDTAVDGFDNVKLDNYNSIDDNTREYYYADFNPDDAAQVGTFDVQAQAVDNSGDSTKENTKDYDSLGHMLFTVDDLSVTAALDTANVVYQVGVSGAISRASGAAATADNVQVMDNYQSDNGQGPFAVDNFTDTAYNDNFSLTSPSRLYQGDSGSVYVWARDDNLDGVSSTVTYTVDGDNASVAFSSVSNNPDNSTVTVTVTWDSDSANVTSGSTYVVNYETFTATIATGSSSIPIDHPSWFYSGAAVVKIYDNADRPLWNVSGTTFETKSITYSQTSFTGDQDNATVQVTLNYKDNTVPITSKIQMRVNNAWYPENAPDENGLVTWEDVDLPDNTENILIILENCYDTRTDILVGCKDVEDSSAFWENTNISYGVDNEAIYYGTSGTLTGSVVSKASYVTLNLVENLSYDNEEVVDNTTTSLTPGENKTWSMTYPQSVTANHFLYFYTDNMWGGENSLVENLWLQLKLECPTGLVPDNENGTTSGAATLEWSPVSGAENYTVQYAENDENFVSPQENAVAENQLALSGLNENRWYWRVRAENENFQSSDWVTHILWVDSTAPSLDNFSGPGSTTSTSPTLSLAASDNLGEVWQVMLSENENFDGTSWQAYATSVSLSLTSGDGTKTVYAKVRDRAGNTSGTLSASVTKTTPSGGDGGSTTTTTTTTTTTVVFTETNPPTLLALTPIPTEVSVSSFTIQVSATDDSTIALTSVTLDNEATPHTFTNGVITVAVIDLSNGPHVVDIVVEDNYNNVSTWTGSFTVKLPPTPVPVEENVEENIPAVPAERLKVENVEVGQEIKFNFVGEVTSITLVPSENVGEMVLTLEMHENLLDPTPPPFDNGKTAYCYFETSLRVNGTENYSASVESFMFEFKVDKAWMENENISDVKLYRLVDNSWQPVSTRFVRDDFTSRYYEAEVEGLSLFSVVGLQLSMSVGSQLEPMGEAAEGISFAVLLTGVFTGIGALAGGIYYYVRYRLPRRARVEVRRELKEGPYLQEIKRSFGPLIERRVRELEQKMEIKSTKGTARAARASKPGFKSR